MKKIFLLSVLTTLFTFSAKAQFSDLYTFERGTNLAGINIGVTFIGDSRTALSGFYEHGLSKLFSDRCALGGGIFGSYFSNNLASETMKAYVAGVIANVHWQFVDGLDTYAGIAPCINIETYKLAKNDARLACYFHAGGRYYLNNWLGLFAEISTGFNNFSGGVSVRF